MTDEDAKGSITTYDFDGDDDDGFDLVATPTTATFRAKYMTFKQGEYLLGAEQEVVPHGTRFIVHAATEGWVRLVRGEPVQRIPREPGKPFPARKELGDLDESKWPVFDGKPSDPWKLSNELLMVARETGQPVILQVTSWSAREKVIDLCRLVTFQRRQRSDTAKPIIAIGAATRQNQRGSFKVPTFTPVDWIGKAETVSEPPSSPTKGGPGAAEMVAEPPLSKLANDLTEHLQARSVLSVPETSAAPKRRPRHKKPEVPPWQDDNDLDDVIPY
jgi:hypothetical protein